MTISDQYTVSDLIPEVFRQEVWQDERPAFNRTSVVVGQLLAILRSFGSSVTVGLCAAVPDAALGPMAPALPIDKLIDAGYKNGRFCYVVDLTFKDATGGINTEMFFTGSMIDVLDGPQGSSSERLARLMVEISPGLSQPEAMLMIAPLAEAVEVAATGLISRLLQ